MPPLFRRAELSLAVRLGLGRFCWVVSCEGGVCPLRIPAYVLLFSAIICRLFILSIMCMYVCVSLFILPCRYLKKLVRIVRIILCGATDKSLAAYCSSYGGGVTTPPYTALIRISLCIATDMSPAVNRFCYRGGCRCSALALSIIQVFYFRLFILFLCLYKRIGSLAG